NYSKNSFKEERLVFADSGGETEQSTSFDPNPEAWKEQSYEAFERAAKAAAKAGRIDKAGLPAILSTAKDKFKLWAEEEKRKSSDGEILKRIEQARKNKEGEKIAKSALKGFERRYLADVAEIRKFVRAEVRELVGVEADDPEKAMSEKAFEEFINFENEIMNSVQTLLEEAGYRDVHAAIERDKERAKRSYQVLRELFSNEEKVNFMRLLLKRKSIPAGSRMDIQSLLNFKRKMEGRWDSTDTLIGVVDARELRGLEQALGAVNQLHEHWDATLEIKRRSLLERERQEYAKNLADFNEEMRDDPPKEPNLVSFLETWPDLHRQRSADLKQIKELIAEDSEASLRLAQTFLAGAREELEGFQEEINSIKAAKKKGTVPDADSRVIGVDAAEVQAELQEADIKGTNAPTREAAKHEESGNWLNKTGVKTKKFFTAHGRLTWYSWHDIEETFRLIKEAWTKHVESHTEDKAGQIAHELMFWRQEVQRRVHETDLIKEKGRAEERKKRYKNLEYESLVAELIEHPARDKRRAILETLAERGNLRMNDRRLVEAVTGQLPEEEYWNHAEASCDYAKIIQKFKSKIDHDFVREIGYGQQLMDMQTAGQHNKEALGEKLADHAMAGSPGAECGMVAVQIDNAGLDGDNILTGMLKKGFERGNKFADNTSFCKIKVNETETVHENATAGLDALKIVDGYLRGFVTNQTIQGLSKKNEGGYTPYAAFQDVLTSKTEEVPEGSGHRICLFEKWGWIEEGKRITALGKRQIINFFDSRVAFDASGGIHHIALDSGTYARHSTKYTTIETFRSANIVVGDKMVPNCLKASGVEIYDNSTSRSRGGAGQIVGRQQEITFLFKSAFEEVEDGVTMIKHGQNDDMKELGRKRLEKGTRALEIMFNNIVKNTEDREIYRRGKGNPAYGILKRNKDVTDKKYGASLDRKNINEKGLEGLLEHCLTKNTNLNKDPEFKSYYNRIIKAYNNFEDETKILSKEEREAKERADDKRMQKTYE
ncbi:MAG: hypothetical protein ABIH35_01755, partial [Patescibacteria group bacterium]